MFWVCVCFVFFKSICAFKLCMCESVCITFKVNILYSTHCPGATGIKLNAWLLVAALLEQQTVLDGVVVLCKRKRLLMWDSRCHLRGSDGLDGFCNGSYGTEHGLPADLRWL
uniref:(northern house mosquito) hypothetical protein n=1 Tax=Culex pipiens TaxID=7175 RepID=A0A8D8MA43_CULPI